MINATDVNTLSTQKKFLQLLDECYLSKDRLIQRIESEILEKAKEGQYQHTLQVDIENSYPFQPKRMLCYEVVNQFQDNGFYVESYTGQNVINILNITIVWG